MMAEGVICVVVLVALMTAPSLGSVITRPTSSSSDNNYPDNSGVTASNEYVKNEDLDYDVSDTSECPTGQYFSASSMTCQPCSACPVNQIIRRPCSAVEDTVCGPFLEFSKFQQSPVSPGEDYRDSSSHSHRHLHHKGHRRHKENDGDYYAFPDGLEGVSVSGIRETVAQWRNLAIAVFCILSAVGVIVVAFSAFICYQRRRQQLMMDKQYHRQPVLLTPEMMLYDGAEPRYVPFPIRTMTSFKQPAYAHVYEEVEDFASLPLVSHDDVSRSTEDTDMGTQKDSVGDTENGTV